MKRLLFALPLFLTVPVFSQGNMILKDQPLNISVPRDSILWNSLMTNELYGGLSSREKEIMYWMNFLRQDPPRFYYHILVPFLEQFPEARGKNANSLQKDLLSSKALPALGLEGNLAKAARLHALEISSGKSSFSHSSAQGNSFYHRMKDAGANLACASENLFDGKDDALLSIILLLLDMNVPDLGHRKSLLNPVFNLVGVSFQPNKFNSNYTLVQDFSCK